MGDVQQVSGALIQFYSHPVVALVDVAGKNLYYPLAVLGVNGVSDSSNVLGGIR